MELSTHGFLEELLQPPRREPPSWDNDFLPSGWSFDSLGVTPAELGLPSDQPPAYQCYFTDQNAYHYSTLVDPEEENFSLLGGLEEIDHGYNNSQDIHGVALSEKKRKSKKVDGQPSKNLMAERRRRKRLNDRLSMLRSIVPKISKMDRTSIVGDTIDYMKELLDKVNKLKEEEREAGARNSPFIKQHDGVSANSPKFNVEKKDKSTQIDICCAAKPGILLSAVTTLESLGLEIQQCVISCFNDFSMQASCSEHEEAISTEDLKQALFRSAGYGGRCS